MKRPLDVTDAQDAREKMPDIKIFGDGNLYELIGKDVNPQQNYMETLKGMDSPSGCHLQVEIRYGKVIAQAVVVIPNAKHIMFNGVKPSQFLTMARAVSAADNFVIETTGCVLYDLENVLLGTVVKTKRIENGGASVALAFEKNGVLKQSKDLDENGLPFFVLA